MATRLEERFWGKVIKTDTCWEWTDYTGYNGYGKLRVQGQMRKAHRLAYEFCIGPIPEGLTLDHLCRNRKCVNPSHLEPVTYQQNILRGEGRAAAQARRTHCPRGHPYDLFNTYKGPDGRRHCRVCLSAEGRRRTRQEKRELVVAGEPSDDD